MVVILTPIVLMVVGIPGIPQSWKPPIQPIAPDEVFGPFAGGGVNLCPVKAAVFVVGMVPGKDKP